MNRLTERKTAYPRCDKQGDLTKVNYIEIKNKGLAKEKLCQLEDIEDELGIDLITLFKLSKAKNVYAYGYNEIIQCALISVNFKEIVVWNGITKTHYQLCDYGTSFALTKEELEK